jgi:hypothetical protein
MDVTGWASHEIEPLLAANWTPAAPGEMPTDEKATGHTVTFTDEQWKTIEAAIIAQSGEDEQSDAQALFFICEKYLLPDE